MRWSADSHTIKLINDGINLVYRFEVNGKGKYLRMTHPNIRSFNELTAAIDFQLYLFTNHAPVCKPVPSQEGNYIETINQGDMLFLAHVTDEVPGDLMHFNHLRNDVFTIWGTALAKLHQAALNYKPARNLHFKTWKDLWNETSCYLPNENDAIKNVFQAINEWFSTLTPTADDFGLIHADHRTGNVLYDGNEVYIIDFDEPVYHWLAADITNPFLELPNKPFASWKPKFLCFIEGYRSILPFSDEQINQLPWFAQMKSLAIYLWCKNNWFEPFAPGGKPRERWLEELYKMALKPIFTY